MNPSSERSPAYQLYLSSYSSARSVVGVALTQLGDCRRVAGDEFLKSLGIYSQCQPWALVAPGIPELPQTSLRGAAGYEAPGWAGEHGAEQQDLQRMSSA